MLKTNMQTVNRIGDFLRMLRSRLNVQLSATHDASDKADLFSTLRELTMLIENYHKSFEVPPTTYETGKGEFLFPLADIEQYTVNVNNSRYPMSLYVKVKT